jgi:hypothetical protein
MTPSDHIGTGAVKRVRPSRSADAPIKGDRDFLLDQFLELAGTNPLSIALEQFFQSVFCGKSVLIWHYGTLRRASGSSTTRVSAQRRRTRPASSTTAIRRVHASDAEAGRTIRRSAPTATGRTAPGLAGLPVPLWNYRNELSTVVEVVHPVHASEFIVLDEDFITWFGNKFRLLSRWLRPVAKFCRDCIPKLQAFIDVRCCEIWKCDRSGGQATRYTERAELISMDAAGIVGASLRSEGVLNCKNNKAHPNYYPPVDGDVEEAMPFVQAFEEFDQVVYCTASRFEGRGRRRC